MGTIQGRGKLYMAGEYICDTRYYFTWEEQSDTTDAFTGRQTTGGLTGAEGSLEPDKRVFNMGEELDLELDNGARVVVTITEGDSSDPLAAVLVQVSSK